MKYNATLLCKFITNKNNYVLSGSENIDSISIRSKSKSLIEIEVLTLATIPEPYHIFL